MTAVLILDRKINMYDVCNRINARVGAHIFAIAICDPVYDKNWGVQIRHPDGTTTDTDIPIGDDSAAAIEAVEALIRLSFRSIYTTRERTKAKVPARYLQSGDRVGSGEIINWVGIGVRTPRGKIEVHLEKAGRSRLAIWNASTLINVEREVA
jgi:hypothetical protein